jgi:hypothetical protein
MHYGLLEGLMTSQHWRDLWDEHADAERQAQDPLPVGKLLEAVRRRKFGDYYTLWYAIAAKATLVEAGWILLDVLESDIDYLHRYHCAAALLQLIGDLKFEPVELSATHFPLAGNLAQVRRVLEVRLGPPPTHST